MNKNRTIKKAYNKTITASLCVTLAAGMICPGNLVYGAEEAEKDENIYVNLNQDGSVADVYVVNEYILEKDTELVDYGNYASVKNLSSNDEITAEDGQVRVNAQEGKFFYQGKLEDAVLPWDIHISYTLDGEVMEASELAGKSGKLKIYVTIRENPEGEENFFDNYLMQATVTLDTEKCGNITAEGATEANVGKDRQLLYNIMAGQEKEFTISANVKDFEMAAITFQAVPMAFDIDSDSLDLDSMTEKIDEIKEAATDFDDGAKELDEGVGELLDGVETLKDGAGDLQSGASELQSGASSLQSGASDLKSGGWDLRVGASKLKSGTGSLQTGTKELKAGTSSLYSGALSAASGSSDLKTGVETLESGLSDVLTGAGEIQQGLANLTENSEDLTSGSESVLTALQTISKSLSGITVGAEQMQTLLDSSTEILAGIEALTAGAQAVTDGLNAISEKYEAIDELEAKNTESAAFLSWAAGMAGTLYETAMQNEKAAAMIESLAGGIDISSSLATLTNIAALLEQNNAVFESLEDGVSEAAAGASSVSSGIAGLKEQYQLFDTEIQKLPVVLENMITSNMEPLKNGIDTLVEEYEALNNGIAEYTTGVAALQEGYEELYQALLLVQSGTGELSSGASELASGNETLASGAGALLSGASAVADGTKELSSGTSDLYNGSVTLYRGLASLYAGTSDLYDGSGELYDGACDLYDGTVDLYDGVSELKDGTEELVEGTEEFVSETEDIDEKIEEEIEKVIEEIAGGDYEAISFVSEENTMVNLVQFVMSTDPISIPKEEAVETEEEKTDFVTKLRTLFEK